jgi:hypothetical protein
MNLLKKLTLSFLSALILLFSVAPYFSVQAATPIWYNQSIQEYYTKVFDSSNPSDIFGERYTFAQVQWVVYSLLGYIMSLPLGPNGMQMVACVMNLSGGTPDIGTCTSLFTASSTPLLQNAQVLPEIPQVKQNLWQMVFADRPLSGVSYIKEKISKFSLIPKVNAQAVGFGYGTALMPIQPMWLTMRDISFSFFVLIVIIFAFLIMFRIKLSPQTVISVQSALPKIVMGLITVTFSYAIAGFMVDLMYVVIGLISVAASQMFHAAPSLYFDFLTTGPFHFGILGAVAFYIVLFFVSFVLILFLSIGVLLTAAAVALGVIAAPILAPLTFILGPLGVIICVIVVVMFIWHTLKIIWELIESFAKILLLTIFAPIQLTLGILIPNFGFSTWIRSLLAELSTFVVVGALMLFSYIFLLMAVATTINQFGFGSLGSIITNVLNIILGTGAAGAINGLVNHTAGWPPLFASGGAIGLIFLGVSFVVYTMIPKATDAVEAFIQGKKFNYGSAIGEHFGPASAVWGFAAGTAVQGVQRGWADNYGTDTTKKIVTTLTDIRNKIMGGRVS